MSEKIFNKSRINYTQISNEILRNNELSWGAKGLLSYMLSRPENWDFNMKEIASNSSESYGMCQKYMKELIDKNYIIRIKRGMKGIKGKFEIIYYLNDRPFNDEEIGKINSNTEKIDISTTTKFNDSGKQRQSLLTTDVSNDKRKSASYNNTDIYTNTDKDNNTDDTKEKLFKENFLRLRNIVVEATRVNQVLVDNVMKPYLYKDIDLNILLQKISESDFLLGKKPKKPRVSHFTTLTMINRILADIYKNNETIFESKENINKNPAYKVL